MFSLAKSELLYVGNSWHHRAANGNCLTITSGFLRGHGVFFDIITGKWKPK